MNIRYWLLPLWLVLVSVEAAENDPLLISAAMLGQERQLNALIAQGADVNVSNAAGRPVLLLAAFNGNARTMRALLAAGADVNALDAGGNSA